MDNRLSKPCCVVTWEKSDYAREEPRSFGTDDDGNDIVGMVKVNGHTMTANVKLCPLHKSAKELLEACKLALELFASLPNSRHSGRIVEVAEQIEAAIAKAECGDKGDE